MLLLFFGDQVLFWSDQDLSAAAEAHPHTTSFVYRAFSAPTSAERTVGRTRIHQALEAASWDINAAIAPTDLGVPAFNRGSPVWGQLQHQHGYAPLITRIAFEREFTVPVE
jgi:hypothetical protein